MSRHDWHRTEEERFLLWCWFQPLVHNLAVAGALCAAFAEGWEQSELHERFHRHGERLGGRWRPGCEL